MKGSLCLRILQTFKFIMKVDLAIENNGSGIVAKWLSIDIDRMSQNVVYESHCRR